MRLSQLLLDMDYTVLQGEQDREISTLVYDSRKVEQDSVFVCISGAVRDGHDFAPEVAAKGAAVLIVEKEVTVPDEVTVIRVADSRLALAQLSAAYFDHPAKELTTIGITGTKGKTTATYMVRSILEASGFKTGLIGTIETDHWRYGDPIGEHNSGIVCCAGILPQNGGRRMQMRGDGSFFTGVDVTPCKRFCI